MIDAPRVYGYDVAEAAEKQGKLRLGDLRVNRNGTLSAWDGASWELVKPEEDR